MINDNIFEVFPIVVFFVSEMLSWATIIGCWTTIIGHTLSSFFLHGPLSITYVIMMRNGIYNIIIFSHGHYFIQPREKVGEKWVYETRFQNIFNCSCNIHLLAEMIFTVAVSCTCILKSKMCLV